MATLIDQYLEWLRVCNRSPRTITARREILHRIDADLAYGLESATAEEIKSWIYRDKWSAATRETYYGAVKSFFTWATSPLDTRLDFDPTVLLPRPTTPRGLPRPVSDRQLQYILTHAAEPFRRYSVLAAYEGLRCCEIAQLAREDITEQATTIRRGKGGKPGRLPTHPAVWEAVKDLPDGPIAYTDAGVPASAQYVSIRTALYFRRQLKLPGVGLHRLRHWYGTTLYARTRDIRRTQELLRHASPTTTAIYTLVSDEERAAAIHALPIFTES